MAIQVALRPVDPGDLPLFLEQQRESGAVDASAFRRWARQLRDPTMLIRTVVVDGAVAGYVARIEQCGTASLAYRLGAAFRARRIGRAALALFLRALQERPLHARVDSGNLASLRLLAGAGFVEAGRGAGPGGGEEILLVLAE